MTKYSGANHLDPVTGLSGSQRRRPLGRWMAAGRPWRSLAALSLIAVATTALAAPSGPIEKVDVAHAITVNPVWSVPLNDAGGPVALSSPNVANLIGGPAVVVGDRAGHVYALNMGNGSLVSGWPASTGGVPVDSTPSVAVTNGYGFDSVFVGVGNASTPGSGGYEAFGPTGGAQWFTSTQNPSTDAAPANAVQASLTVGNIQGGPDVVAGSLGEVTQAMNATSGAMLPGFPWFQADSNFTTPVVADIYGNGQNDIIEGGDSTAGSAYGTSYSNGGHLRVVLPSGNAFQANPNGGVVCQYNTDETVESSPAVGEFLGGGGVGIVFGTGNTYHATTTDDLIALNSHCGAAWTDKLNGVTTSSPALANVTGSGQLDVVEGTQAGASSSVYALNGTNGAVLWQTGVGNPVIGSVVTADLAGAGYQDVIVPTTNGVKILDGQTGSLVDTIGANIGFQNSPLITDDADGTVGITIAGYNSSNQGVVQHFEVAATNGAIVNETGAWPMFHHDPQLTGNAGTPPPVIQVPCNAPRATATGYEMVASDGGVFNYGNMPFCGSTGNIVLDAPMVGIATTHDNGGYWTVASDGGIFAFGDANFYGSMGGKPLDKPIVGMAATANGGGYWLVASDGGIFAFGNAGFYGSMGNKPLNKPIVGMAATADGGGYWLVASDGGIFAFGDAKFYGSMGNKPLNKPVVGMAADDATGGYWLTAADGGIFAFNAPFLGSTGNIALHQPVVGMQATANGQGYRFVAADGGIFAYGAPFDGSTGNIALVKPVVGMTGF